MVSAVRPSMSRAHRPPRSVARGFSLLEVIIVLVVLGTLAALAYPRFTGTDAFASASFAEQVAASLRYAQRYAVSTGCEVQVDLDAGAEQVALTRRAGGDDQTCGSGAFSVALPLPGQDGDYVIAAADGVDVSVGFQFYFDAEGIPQPGGASAVIGGRSLSVEAGSGHVH